MHDVLTLNAGSSSLKFALFPLGSWRDGARMRGQIDGLGGTASFSVDQQDGEPLHRETLTGAAAPRDAGSALDLLLRWLAATNLRIDIGAVGHRVVHGGTFFSAPTVLNDGVLARLDGLAPLAPLHQPHNVAGIRAARARFPGALQVACFDTAFHSTAPWENQAFALPHALYEDGVRRYGFHGLSYEYVISRLRQVAPESASGKVVIAHLGNGASMCGVDNGESVASTMGFSALDGLPMGTRCGRIDPGVLLYLLGERGMDIAALTRLLYNESGLKGLSGLSHDMRALDASDDPRANAAKSYFVAQIRRELGALAAALGGLDAIVFTGGIGENSAAIRAAVCDGLGWLGVGIDPDLNTFNATELTAPGARVRVYRIPTDEEAVIARRTLAELALAETAALTAWFGAVAEARLPERECALAG